MDHRTVVDVLSRLAFAREVLEGATPQARAYARAARALRRLRGDLREMLESGALAEVRGIGPSTLRVVGDVLAGREPEELQALEAQIPPGLFAIRRIKGLGPARIRKLWKGLGITTLGELEHACRENRLLRLDGFGPKTQADVLAAIEKIRHPDSVLLRSRAKALLEPLLSSLRMRGVRAEAIGDYARGLELVSSIAIAVAGDERTIAETLAAHGVRDGRIDGAPFEARASEPARFGVVVVLGASSDEALLEQAAMIARARHGPGCVLLTGVESDILADGSLDYEPDVLAAVEVVIASVHRRFGLDRDATTRRYVAAVRNPYTDVIGHPTGRLLLGRPPNEFDLEAMLDAAAESGCAVELNASPHRLDLDARGVAMAKERGVLVAIAADAHSPEELGQLEHGIAVARRGGLTPDDVLNCKPLDALRAWLAARRARAGVRALVGEDG
jgi:histidinol phosphatase-like PHP family hydrolase